jgi:hypothetical protein
MYDKSELRRIIALCNDVKHYAEATIAEAESQRRYDVEKREYVTGPQWPYYGGSKTTGALRRRSLDLTRALAELRKP